MITLHDLETAIAHCQGEPNPDSQTCIKLAAFYTIKEAMFGDKTANESPRAEPGYSYDPGPQQETVVAFDGATSFAKAVQGRPACDVWAVVDELMSVLGATNKRLYDGVMRELRK